MKIYDAYVEWMHRYANHPHLCIVVDEIPKLSGDQAIWTQDDNRIVWAEEDGYVNYVLQNATRKNPEAISDKSHRGFGGRTFIHTLKDGTVLKGNNCWSSRATCVMGFHCADVTFYEGHRRITGISGAIGIGIYRDLVEGLGFHLVRMDGENPDPQPRYVISTSRNEYTKPESMYLAKH